MYSYERPGYSEEVTFGQRFGLALLWVLANTVASVAIQLLGFSIGNVEQVNATPFLQVVLSGIAVGLIVGVAQTLVVMRFLGGASSVKWLVATVVGSSVRWIVATLAASTLLSLGSGVGAARISYFYSIVGTCLVFLFLMAVLGVITGVFLGMAQQVVLRQHFQRTRRWIMLTALGSALSFLVEFLYLADERIGNVLGTAIAAGITAIALVDIMLQKPRAAASAVPSTSKHTNLPSDGDTQLSPEELLERARLDQLRKSQGSKS